MATRKVWILVEEQLLDEALEALRAREERGDSPNAGDVQRAHLRVQRALEALGATLGSSERRL
jgi:hypothetical protein